MRTILNFSLSQIKHFPYNEQSMKRLIFICILMIVLTACGSSSPSLSPNTSVANGPLAAQPLESTSSGGLEGCVTDPTTLIRKEPTTDSNVVTGIVAGTCLTVLERNADSTWFYVSTKDNFTGWIDAKFVNISPQSVVNSPSNTQPCSQLANQTGSNVTCTIEKASCVFRPELSHNPTFCYDQTFPERTFQLVAVNDDWSNYDSRCLIVSGELEAKFDGQRAWLQITGTNRSQVSECSTTTSP